MLAAEGLRKSYSSGGKAIRVLQGVDLRLPKGSFTAIVGPSGAGKSTLLHILGGLDAPDEGRVVFEGHDVYALNDAAISRVRNEQIGFVFQFYHLLPEFTALENVMMPSLIRHGSLRKAAAVRKEALRLLGEAGLSERTEHFPAELSGGEQQRTAIARALINRPRLLLCDEPTGNLDSKTGEEILSLLQRIHRESHATMVVVTHNQELAKSAEVVFHLRDGTLAK